jgi:hypothetical protein
VQVESRCHVVSEPHADTQELWSRSITWLNVYVSHPTPRRLSPANSARGLRVRTRRCINARTPETGTNHLGGSFDSVNAKAVATPIKPAEANPKPIVMGRGFLRALF